MSERWMPQSIELRGFLGVGREPLRLELERPLTILVGPNGSGKSTIVSALEWALFGELELGDVEPAELKGAGAGRYAVYLHRGCDEAEVVLRLRRDGSQLEWRRMRRRADPKRDIVACTLDGTSTEPDPALLGLTHPLYARAIAPRQTTLAVLVSRDERERDAALDVLFGIEELNVLCQGLSTAKSDLQREVRELEARLSTATVGVRRNVAWRFDRRAEARQRALETGLRGEELSLQGARRLAAELARELEIPLPSEDADLEELHALHAKLQEAADEAWARPQVNARRARLDAVRRLLEHGAPARWREAANRAHLAREGRRAVEQRLGRRAGCRGRGPPEAG
ncbi:MAG: hypothetical protein C4306_11150 [Thermoleophilia bacterium]